MRLTTPEIKRIKKPIKGTHLSKKIVKLVNSLKSVINSQKAIRNNLKKDLTEMWS